MISVTVSKMGKTKIAMEKLTAKLGKRVGNALVAVARAIEEESQKNVPKDTNTLMLSMREKIQSESTFAQVIIISYGDKDIPARTALDRRGVMRTRTPSQYAVPVHERGGKDTSGFDFLHGVHRTQLRFLQEILRKGLERA